MDPNDIFDILSQTIKLQKDTEELQISTIKMKPRSLIFTSPGPGRRSWTEPPYLSSLSLKPKAA